MTKIQFFTEGIRITGFEVKGHSGYAEEGQEIVCSAITSAVRLVECSINEVLGLGATVKVNPRYAKISFYLPGGLSETTDNTCQSLLTGFMVYMTELREEYPENIEVSEVIKE